MSGESGKKPPESDLVAQIAVLRLALAMEVGEAKATSYLKEFLFAVDHADPQHRDGVFASELSNLIGRVGEEVGYQKALQIVSRKPAPSPPHRSWTPAEAYFLGRIEQYATIPPGDRLYLRCSASESEALHILTLTSFERACQRGLSEALRADSQKMGYETAAAHWNNWTVDLVNQSAPEDPSLLSIQVGLFFQDNFPTPPLKTPSESTSPRTSGCLLFAIVLLLAVYCIVSPV